ncbi:competence type IV pilus major pilin ComGC [Priestia endophytica]|jgi:competence protein ComGC|uniref:competence type IV pilus major pilin ComGC n=1 Tax=Priestia endophytica TaxID=135735 RepID=UPI000F520D8B|nr:competence type IV pilus major pilin ComGC [Priestia endophytica]MED4070546.1 competence type IV pilus major pilin ComGC [Priestia endophytica]RPK15727.1 hypothetical protein FH5_01162 [Priestia endophytica]
MMKNEKGFTLIEMLIVMLVITVLLLIMIPNIVSHNKAIRNKGCEAFLNTVEAQVQVYEIEKGKKPTMNELIEGGYLKEAKCPNGTEITINADGKASEVSGG